MKIHFFKYHGTGNDFIMIDNRNHVLDNRMITDEKIRQLCDRRFGIGADGLILIDDKINTANNQEIDFIMRYFNADGSEGAMCGNGGRCAVAFAYHINAIPNQALVTRFLAIDGLHEASITKDDTNLIVRLKMIDLDRIDIYPDFFYLNTGAPHYVRFIDNVDSFNVFDAGRKIRYSKDFQPLGTNANFVEQVADGIKIRTYERGVEDETYACGTGSVASSICAKLLDKTPAPDSCKVYVKGGILNVYFEQVSEQKFRNIWLEGSATFVFAGEIEVEE